MPSREGFERLVACDIGACKAGSIGGLNEFVGLMGSIQIVCTTLLHPPSWYPEQIVHHEPM